MEIEFWFDYGCPYCYKGLITLQNALSSRLEFDQVTLHFRSFLLSPEADNHCLKTRRSVLKEKYGMTDEAIDEEAHRLFERGRELEIDFQGFDQWKDMNTMKLHQIEKYASMSGREIPWISTVMKAYFTNRADVSQDSVLLNLAESIGLDRHEVKKVMTSNIFVDYVYDDLKKAEAINIESIPLFVVNNNYAISGVLPIDDFVEALLQIQSRSDDKNITIE